MFPIRDHNPSERTPFVTYALIAVNVVVFLGYLPLLGDEARLQAFFLRWALIPARLAAGDGYATLVTSMFLHGGLLHLAGNMLFLWIFGDNLRMIALPAWVMLGVWFALQAVNSYLGFGLTGGGVAHLAHAGGFVAGVLLALPWWLRAGGPGFWRRTHGVPPHAATRGQHRAAVADPARRPPPKMSVEWG